MFIIFLRWGALQIFGEKMQLALLMYFFFEMLLIELVNEYLPLISVIFH